MYGTTICSNVVFKDRILYVRDRKDSWIVEVMQFYRSSFILGCEIFEEGVQNADLLAPLATQTVASYEWRWVIDVYLI